MPCFAYFLQAAAKNDAQFAAVSQNGPTFACAILLNADQFSKFFHLRSEQ